MSLSVNGDNSQHVNGTTTSSNVKTPKTSTKKNPIPLKGKKKKAAKKRYDYKLGPREGNTRIIGPDSISTAKPSIDSIYPFIRPNNGRNNISGKIDLTKIKISPRNNNNQNLNPDGSVGTFKQGQRGDCYFLAEINAIKNTKDGQKILDQNVKYNAEEGTYTVTLPGAIKMRHAYQKDGLSDKCEITGKYTITKEALNKAKKLAGDSYSAGDIEVIALEIAMENYRAELAITNKNTGNRNISDFTAEGSGANSTQDLLAGGHTYDAGFILTGQKSEVYFNKEKMRQPDKLYTAGEYGFITEEEMNARHSYSSKMIALNATAKGMSEVTSVTSNNAALSHKLDKYQGKENQYALTCYVTCAKQGEDGVTKAGGGHAVTILKITDDVVYVQNPWYDPKDPSKKGKTIEPIPRAAFEKMASGFVAQNMDPKKVNNTRLDNTINDIYANNQRPHGRILAHEIQLANQIFAKISHNNGSKFNGINSDKLNTLITKIQKKNKQKMSLETLNKLATTNLKGKDKVTTDRMITYLQAQNNTQLSPELLKDIQELLDKFKRHNS